MRFSQPRPVVRLRILIVISVCVVAIGCDRGPSLTEQIQAVGGFATLQRDCRLYFDRSRGPQDEAWVMGKTNDLPATVAALRPQIVTNRRDINVVDIQTSGGFNHHGLIVCLTNMPPEFYPASRWRVTKLADGVFEYRE
jgi:hypothetical protein